MKMSNKMYDFLKNLCTVWIPASIALFVGLNQLWNFTEYGEQIAGTMALIATFIGSIIGISSKNYWAEMEGEENGSN